MSFPYKNVLIIGSTSGIGLALAERMIENGVFVIGVGRRRDRLDDFVAKHGSEKAAASRFDITNLAGIKSWVEQTVTTYPSLDAVVLNSGIQRTINFTKPETIDLDLAHQELTTNYISYLHLVKYFLPHLQAQAPKPTALMFVSSGLSLVPIPRCGNYCATKAALHSLCWTMRAQLAYSEETKHIKVIEILPPAVQTELHSQQQDLVDIGEAVIGITIGEFTDDAWAGLVKGEEEIPTGPLKETFDTLERPRRETFKFQRAVLPPELLKNSA